MQQERLNKVQEILQEMVDTDFVSGVNCVVFQNGKEQGYFETGYADLESKTPLKRDTIFRLYSMSKPITSAAVMTLIEDGKIDITLPIAEYLPGYDHPVVAKNHTIAPAVNKVTVQQLLNMTSGYTYEGTTDEAERSMTKLFTEIKEKMYTDRAMTTMEIAEIMGGLPLAFEPGETFRYGVSADILGALVEAVSGKTFGEYLKERIFDPLGMADTGFYVPEEKQHRLAKVYQGTAEGLALYTIDNLGISNDMKLPPAFESGGAGLVSTIDDYAKFTKMLLNGGTYEGKQILRPETVKFMSTAHISEKQAEGMVGWESLPGFSYGNLLRIMIHPDQAITLSGLGEYGWDGWLGCYMMVDPMHDLTFLMMYQRTDCGTTTYTRRVRNVIFSALD